MPFSFNLNHFGRYNAQPVSQTPSPPMNGLAPAYDGPGGPAYGGVPQNNPGYDTDTRSNQRETQPRWILSLVTSCCLFITVIFLIMVEIGNTSNKPGLRDIYFIKLDFSNISPAQNNTPGLGYGIAEAAGFYDFYQVGLWNYCEGWNSTGIAQCTKPQAMYWWDPIEMFTSQIYGNSSFSLPSNMYDDLDEIRICSHWMFGMFMTVICLSFVLVPVVLLGMKTKWISLGMGVITFFNAIMSLAASCIATVMWYLIRNLFRDYEEVVNIVPTIGYTIFAMMWIATAFTIIAFGVQVYLSLFCPSERDIRRRNRQSPMKSYML